MLLTIQVMNLIDGASSFLSMIGLLLKGTRPSGDAWERSFGDSATVYDGHSRLAD